MPASTRFLHLQTGRKSQKINLALFAITFLCMTSGTSAFWLLKPHKPMPVAFPAPPSSEYYLAVDNGISLDHNVLFHGAYGTEKFMKAADVLLLGNSRLMFGFPQDPFKELFQKFGMSYYMLGFGQNEADLFPQDIITKFDLHPKVVIVNADYFFVGARTLHAEEVRRETEFEFRKDLFEGTAVHRVRQQLHKVLPHWLFLCEQREELIVYRSRSDGTWLAPRLPPYVYPAADQPGPMATPLYPHHFDVARKFKKDMEERGAQVVLTFIPSAYGTREFAEQFAKELNVPLIAPKLTGLETFDISHLNHKSAQRFTAAFLAGLNETFRSQASATVISRGEKAAAHQ